jgi:hypothetical protein
MNKYLRNLEMPAKFFPDCRVHEETDLLKPESLEYDR